MLRSLVLQALLYGLFSTSVIAFETSGKLPEHWINGEDCQTEARVQVHEYNADFFILRQSVCTHFEAPFIYLIFGQEKVLMLDTGASNVNLVAVVDSVIEQWLTRNQKADIELIVTHSHGHSDHVFADEQFSARANTKVVGKTAEDVIAFFQFTQWPNQQITYDLGGRTIQILPLPGHEPSHIVIYDPTTQLLLTGDSLYPGRLYFRQLTFHLFKDSIKRLSQWVKNKPISHVLGTHIEMTNQPGKDYPFEASQHLNERHLQLTKTHIIKLQHLLNAMTLPATKKVSEDFILFPLD